MRLGPQGKGASKWQDTLWIPKMAKGRLALNTQTGMPSRNSSPGDKAQLTCVDGTWFEIRRFHVQLVSAPRNGLLDDITRRLLKISRRNKQCPEEDKLQHGGLEARHDQVGFFFSLISLQDLPALLYLRSGEGP